MNLFKRTHNYRGYGKPGLFAASSTAHRFSNRKLMLVLAVVAGGVFLLTWGLLYLQGKP